MSTDGYVAASKAIDEALSSLDANIKGCTPTMLVSALSSLGYMIIAKPDATQPSPALIEAAYIAQDDLSKPPSPWLIGATAEIINEYIGAQGHTRVHVIGHPQETP